MKKIFFSLIITFSLLILSNEESIGCSCPQNYSFKSYLITLPNTNCVIQFNVCIKCSPTGNPEVRFCSVYIDINDPSCTNANINPVDWSNMKKEVMGLVLKDCPETQIPPCPTQSNWTANYYEAFCLEAIYNGVEERVELIPCDVSPGLCETQYSACMNNGQIVVTIQSGPSVSETGDCGPGALSPIFPPPDGCFSYCY